MKNTVKNLQSFISYVQKHLNFILSILPFILLFILLFIDLLFEMDHMQWYLFVVALSGIGIYRMHQEDKRFYRQLDETLRKAQQTINDYHARKEKEEKENWDRFIRILFEELEN